MSKTETDRIAALERSVENLARPKDFLARPSLKQVVAAVEEANVARREAALRAARHRDGIVERHRPRIEQLEGHARAVAGNVAAQVEENRRHLEALQQLEEKRQAPERALGALWKQINAEAAGG